MCHESRRGTNKIYFFTATVHKWFPLLGEENNQQLIVDYLKKLVSCATNQGVGADAIVFTQINKYNTAADAIVFTQINKYKTAADAGVITCITKHNTGRLVVVSAEIQYLRNGCVAGDNTCNGIYSLVGGVVKLLRTHFILLLQILLQSKLSPTPPAGGVRATQLLLLLPKKYATHFFGSRLRRYRTKRGC